MQSLIHESSWESISFYVQNKFVVKFMCSPNSNGLIQETTNKLYCQNNI